SGSVPGDAGGAGAGQRDGDHHAHRPATGTPAVAPHLAGSTGSDALQFHDLGSDRAVELVRRRGVLGAAALDGGRSDDRPEPRGFRSPGRSDATGLGPEPAVGAAPAAAGRADDRPVRAGDRYGPAARLLLAVV